MYGCVISMLMAWRRQAAVRQLNAVNFPKLGGGGRRAQGRLQQPTRVYTEPHAPAGMSPAAQAAYKAIRQGKGKGRGKRVQRGRAQTGKGTASGQ